ncbi:MAG: trypsin, partial [Pseudomonadota bacterium]
LDKQDGSGGTELIPALKRALDLPRTKGTSRIIVTVTDGYVSVEKDAFELIRANLGKANLFSFGIGSSVNRFIIEGMARAGLGEPFVILNKDGADATADKFREYILSPVLQGIDVSYKDFGAYDVEPESLPDLFAMRPIMLIGKFKGDAKGKITVTGTTPAGKFQQSVDLASGINSPDNSALQYLWARQKIMYLSDMNKLEKDDARVKEITNLGLKYHLMTDYTSFIAIDKIKRADGKFVTVKQPLPLPQGVSDRAVGESKMKLMRASGLSQMAAMPMKDELLVEPEEAPLQAALSLSVKKVELIKGKDSALTADVVKSAIESSAIKSCAKVKGKLTYKITVDADGKVSTVSLVKNETKDASIDACISNLLKNIAFTKPASAKELEFKVVIEIK